MDFVHRVTLSCIIHRIKLFILDIFFVEYTQYINYSMFGHDVEKFEIKLV